MPQTITKFWGPFRGRVTLNFNWPVIKFLIGEVPPLTLRGMTGVIGWPSSQCACIGQAATRRSKPGPTS